MEIIYAFALGFALGFVQILPVKCIVKLVYKDLYMVFIAALTGLG